jgi:sugar lactone lactonase YvrE
MMLPELHYNAKATLGEGPAWDAKNQTLYWVDVLEKRIYAGGKLFLQLDELVSCLAPRNDGGLVIAQRPAWTSTETNKLSTLASPKASRPTTASATASVTRMAGLWQDHGP